MDRKAFLIGLALATTPIHAHSQNVGSTTSYAQLTNLPVPVVAGDITDRPYRVIGTVIAGVRRATVFSRNPSEEKVYRELWERARRLGADAVVNAQYGEAHITAFSWGSREARGTAIKFLTDAEIADRNRRN